MKMTAEAVREYIKGRLAQGQTTLEVTEERFGEKSWQSMYVQGYNMALHDVLNAIR